MADAAQNQIVQVREGGGSTSYQFPMLSATNYTSWAIKMESFMDAQGLWDAIQPPAGANIDVRLGKKARAFIFQALPEDILLQVAGHTEARAVWEALRTRFLGADRVQQARIQTLNQFMAATACQAIWLKGLLEEITGQSVKAITLHVDNKSAIQLMKNPVFHGRSKHIDTRYHFIRECVEEELVKIEHVSGEKQKADILTKALSRIKFAEMRSLIGVEDLENKKTEIKGVNVS
ncbi:hypothetical protein E3N88_18004 [Mikania micrantha]|uniref:DUF4219 domain-containing protein n=1 Tax=Mikania micrantha TaxID=192012 RepID=A0A5N6NW69_9ASTR|nr:hypothetical protein E3N88_18004 [Mikania micrantha]